MSHFYKRQTVCVLRSLIDVVDWDKAVARINSWAIANESRYVCIVNAHSVVTAAQNQDFQRVINGADMSTPDGAPVAWLMRRMGCLGQERINGPDLMWKYCEKIAGTDESVYLFGGTQGTLDILKKNLLEKIPGMNIAGAYSPPFRTLTKDENDEIVAKINASGAGTVWVGLGCPKQEEWMAENRGKVNAVMVGVGAAFDYHAGTIIRAPLWMQRNGLEWLHRLFSEPRRLWRRYFVTNTLFILLAARQLIFK